MKHCRFASREPIYTAFLLGMVFTGAVFLIASVAKADTMNPMTWTPGIDASELMPPPDPAATQPPPPVVLDPVWTAPTSGDTCVAMNSGDESYRDCYVGDGRPLPEWLAYFND